LRPDEKTHLTQSGYSKVFVLLPMQDAERQHQDTERQHQDTERQHQDTERQHQDAERQ